MPRPTWTELLATSQGQYAVYASKLGSPQTLTHHSDDVVEAASTIKVAVLIVLLDACQQKRLSLRKQIELRRSSVGRNGSGLLQSMYFNAPFTLYNLAFLMMSISDNVATNVIIDLLGFDSINSFIKTDIGLQHTRLVMKKLDFPRGFTLSAHSPMALTTPRDMGTLLERLAVGSLLDPYHTRIALRMMARIQRSTFNRRLPERSIQRFASKTGWIDAAKEHVQILNECGLIETKAGARYVFSVFAKLPIDKELTYSLDAPARIEYAEFARALFEALESL
jgi:beta-lactamase class A